VNSQEGKGEEEEEEGEEEEGRGELKPGTEPSADDLMSILQS
jgi:hypothetical protein